MISFSRVLSVRSLLAATIILLGLPVSASNVTGTALKWRFGIEVGPVWQSRNDVQIPGDAGTRFSLADFAGSGPFPFYRLELTYDINPRHSLRFLVAPFEYTESGTFNSDVFFVDQIFDAGQATEASYRFNSYRATYRYLFYDTETWRWHIGVTAKIRDAEITLKQAGKSATDSNTGVVPLLNLYGEYQLADRWNFIFDFDGLASPQGRAIDLGLIARYDISRQWYVGGGYRMLEGGADNSEVYNFAWFNYLLLSAGYRF
jgi:hypothetical protein